ncbi:MAG: branched-chain-amino-acid transaminase [Spirochaetales bacterium]|nr:branched-chain-amino-acid transaminase [Spirochaetales bacterium]
MAFDLSVYPWVYMAKYEHDTWSDSYIEKPHKTPQEEAALSPDERQTLLRTRNSFPELPLVNYTTQYGMGCFEGLKAFPHKDGSMHLFRPDENAARFKKSMEGLMMPAFPEDMFVHGVAETVRRNNSLGFRPVYDPAWEKTHFIDGHAVYVRPFSYSEPAIGLGLSKEPWVVAVSTPVGSYFRPGNTKAVTTDKVRAYPGGTGWIKCDANYVVPILAKKTAEKKGFMEAIFLDAAEHTYIEEGSSCNIFFYLKNGTLVTPDLADTILPGITRKSVLTLAQDLGISTEERKISIDEALSDGREVFVTGTAAGISHFESITHKGTTVPFGNGNMGEVTTALCRKLKGIQYGAEEDIHQWMVRV